MRGAHSYYSPPGAKNLTVPMSVQRRCVKYSKKTLGLFCMNWEYGNERSSSIKGVAFLCRMTDCYLPKKDWALWSSCWSPAFTIEFKNAWGYTSNPPYVHMTRFIIAYLEPFLSQVTKRSVWTHIVCDAQLQSADCLRRTANSSSLCVTQALSVTQSRLFTYVKLGTNKE